MQSSKYCWDMENNAMLPRTKGSKDWKEGARSRDFRARGVCLRQVDLTCEARTGQQLSPPGHVLQGSS